MDQGIELFTRAFCEEALTGDVENVTQYLDRLDEPAGWVKARLVKLESVKSEHLRELSWIAAHYATHQRYQQARLELVDAIQALMADTWMPPRPGRRTPSYFKVADYWLKLGWFGQFDLDFPMCFRCGRVVASWRDLERAHLVDRWRDGLDHEANLVLLCPQCHASMGSYGPAEGVDALCWVLRGPNGR